MHSVTVYCQYKPKFIFRLGKLHNSYFIYTMKVSGKIIDARGLDMSLSIADIYGTTTPFKC